MDNPRSLAQDELPEARAGSSLQGDQPMILVCTGLNLAIQRRARQATDAPSVSVIPPGHKVGTQIA